MVYSLVVKWGWGLVKHMGKWVLERLLCVLLWSLHVGGNWKSPPSSTFVGNELSSSPNIALFISLSFGPQICCKLPTNYVDYSNSSKLFNNHHLKFKFGIKLLRYFSCDRATSSLVLLNIPTYSIKLLLI